MDKRNLKFTLMKVKFLPLGLVNVSSDCNNTNVTTIDVSPQNLKFVPDQVHTVGVAGADSDDLRGLLCPLGQLSQQHFLVGDQLSRERQCLLQLLLDCTAHTLALA